VHRFDGNAPGGPVSSYETYSVGPVLGYELFIFKGLYANAYLRYWPQCRHVACQQSDRAWGTNGRVKRHSGIPGVMELCVT
jgi:hypothetical protein